MERVQVLHSAAWAGFRHDLVCPRHRRVTYYALVLCSYGPALLAATGALDALAALAVLVLFHFVLVMLLWSYFSVVFTDPGAVPPNWRPDVDEERGETAPLTTSDLSSLQSMALNDTGSPRIRYFRKCNQLKPPRCHHCSVCGRCVLKMDHHCVWVVNCVGALNYKFFLLFLFYTFLETAVVTLFLLPYFIAFFSDAEFPGTPGALATTFLTLVKYIVRYHQTHLPKKIINLPYGKLLFSLAILNLAFSLSVLGFMIMRVLLVSANTTTIEAYEKKSTPFWKYDLRWKRNFSQVFETNKWYWFIPTYSEEDLRRMSALQGLDYPVRSDFDKDVSVMISACTSSTDN